MNVWTEEEEDQRSIYIVGHCLEDPMDKIKNMELISDYKHNTHKYTLEFAMRVKNPKQKNDIVQSTLDDYEVRVVNLDDLFDENLDLFKCSKSQIINIFQSFVGDWY